MKTLSMAITAAFAMTSGAAMACNCGPARTPLTAAPKALQVVTAPATATPAALVTKGEPTLVAAKDDRWVGTRAGRDIGTALPTRLSALRGEAEDDVAVAEPVKVATTEAAKSDAKVGTRQADTRKRDDDDRPSRGGVGGMTFGGMTFFGAGGAGSSGASVKTTDSGTPAGTSPLVVVTAPTGTSPLVVVTAPTGTSGDSKTSPAPTTYSPTITTTTTPTVTGGTGSNSKPPSSHHKGEHHATSGGGHDMHKGDGHKGGSNPYATNFVSQYVPAYLPATRTWSDPNASAPRYGFFDANGDGKPDVYGVVWADLNHLNKTGTAAKPGVLSAPYLGDMSGPWVDPAAGKPVLGWYDKDGDGKPEAYGVVYADVRHTPAAQATSSWTVNKPGHGHGHGHGHGGGAGGGHGGHHGRPPISKH